MKISFLISALALLCAGCWTFGETDYPTVQIALADSGAKTVRLVGFEAQLTEWMAVHGYRTAVFPGYYGYRHYEPGFVTTIPSVDYVPQKRPTDLYLRRAQDAFEKAGFVLAPEAELTVDVSFEGPFETSGDMTKDLAWNVCTLFFCDRGAARWKAKLRIRETKTGRLVFHRDYEQPYVTCVFGLIPLFGPASCDATDDARMQGWCLSALTDRICADATSFVAGKRL